MIAIRAPALAIGSDRGGGMQTKKRRATGQKILWACALVAIAAAAAKAEIGAERSTYERLEDGEEFQVSLRELLRRGAAAFTAEWTAQEGGGRPLTNGAGGLLIDGSRRLEFPHAFNRVSSMDANSCAGCHDRPFGSPGGGGEFAAGVFVAAQRFDFATFNSLDLAGRRGALDERGLPATLQTIGNYRASLGMYGSGYIEMLARQMTEELRLIRDAIGPGEALALETKGVGFGMLARDTAGQWLTHSVEGLPPQSVSSSGPDSPPSLIIHPFHQSGSVVSLRQFTNNAYNHHHGMQPAERFGNGVDADGDAVVDELTRADITAVAVFQATLSVPSQVLPREPEARRAIHRGSELFSEIGCAGCHVPALPLVDGGWVYTEPNPYNPPGNLRPGEAETFSVDLTSPQLPGRRLKPVKGVVWVPAFTDLKLHDITSGPGDPSSEALDINQPGGSPAFFAGNRRFLTKKLWGAANEKPYFHHGLFTTLREATLAHAGEALDSRKAFVSLSDLDQARTIEFLKSLQTGPPDRSGN